MYKIFTLVFLSTFFVSCLQDPMEPALPEIPSSCTAEVNVFRCESLNCDEIIDVENLEVRLYNEYTDAFNGEEPIFSQTTNVNGWVKFFDIDCEESYIVRVDLGIFGVYMGPVSFRNFTTPNPIIDVRVVDNYYYDFKPSPNPIIRNISLEQPYVGQRSIYKYFEHKGGLSYGDESFYVEEVELRVVVDREKEENTFQVIEYLSSSQANYDLSHLGFVANQFPIFSTWHIEEDTLFILPNGHNQNTEFVSHLWNIRMDELVDGEYAISLSNQSNNFLDMTGEFEIPIPDWQGVAACSEYEFQDYLFEDLLVEKNDTRDEGRGLKYRVFSPKYGVVRSLHYSDDPEITSSGFDLIFQD